MFINSIVQVFIAVLSRENFVFFFIFHVSRLYKRGKKLFYGVIECIIRIQDLILIIRVPFEKFLSAD